MYGTAASAFFWDFLGSSKVKSVTTFFNNQTQEDSKMTRDELAKRDTRAATETLVIAMTDEGYRVYSPASPTKFYLVSADLDAPACTCPDFQLHRSDPDWRCKHVLAVANRLHPQNHELGEPDTEGAEERAQIPEEGRPSPRRRTPRATNGSAHMLIKRSVSPDGRIDSLSIEFATPVEKLSVGEIRERADAVLHLQADIVGGFLGTHAAESVNGETGNGNGAPEGVAAHIVGIAGMNGKFGRRLFLNVQVNGHTLKLFGNRKQLAEAIARAGFPDRSDNIAEGINLNIPCRVITKPSEDGRFVNIDTVFPAASLRPSPRGRP